MKILLCHWHGFISISIPHWNKYASGLGPILYFPVIFLERRLDSCPLFSVFLLWGGTFQQIPSPFRLEKFKPGCSLQSSPSSQVLWHLSLSATCLLCLLDSLSLVRLYVHGRPTLYPWFPPSIGTGQDTQWMFNESRSLPMIGPVLLCARLLWDKALKSLRSSADKPRTFERQSLRFLDVLLST